MCCHTCWKPMVFINITIFNPPLRELKLSPWVMGGWEMLVYSLSIVEWNQWHFSVFAHQCQKSRCNERWLGRSSGIRKLSDEMVSYPVVSRKGDSMVGWSSRHIVSRKITFNAKARLTEKANDSIGTQNTCISFYDNILTSSPAKVWDFVGYLELPIFFYIKKLFSTV